MNTLGNHEWDTIELISYNMVVVVDGCPRTRLYSFQAAVAAEKDGRSVLTFQLTGRLGPVQLQSLGRSRLG